MSENVIVKVHRITPNGTLNSSFQLEIDASDQVIKQADLSLCDVDINIDRYLLNWNYQADNKLFPNLNYHRFIQSSSPTVTVIKFGEFNELNPMNYMTKINASINNVTESNYIFTETDKQQMKRLNLPDSSVISCQNCDTSFPTKYQYQRHQCEFNAEKVVLKAEVVGKNVDKASRLRFECDICKKSFVSNNNLERHKNCHRNKSNNICEFCSKTFVSENRLKIHKENHCKKAGDTTKFYRSDVVVWRCEQCKQVFATQECGNKHLKACKTIMPCTSTAEDAKPVDDSNQDTLKNICDENNFDSNFEKAINLHSNTSEGIDFREMSTSLTKIITEVLYQCEFCNRTYAAKPSVLNHQKTHTTEKNYECMFCQQHFDNYNHATQHWQNKCIKESNLFYLPKMIYCEHCDRGFKSHEILYNHKNKKKHFTPKLHSNDKENTINEGARNMKTENEKAIVKLIENMINKMDHQSAQNTSSENQIDSDSNSYLMPVENIKLERETEGVQENGKKKRGRKRKWHKFESKNKRLLTEDGCQYQCERCATVFESISALDGHKDSAHASTYRCDQCGQVVHSSKALVIHCRAHQSLKPYVCDQCGRSYSQTSHLWQHMRFHQGIKPFACPHEGCEARYTIRPDLKDHIRKVHTRERPFKCSVCQKCFLTGSVYYQHRLIHTNDRRYGCEICNKRFFRADALNNHRRIHTDERPYPCPICGREFRQKGDRNKHVRTQHPL